MSRSSPKAFLRGAPDRGWEDGSDEISRAPSPPSKRYSPESPLHPCVRDGGPGPPGFGANPDAIGFSQGLDRTGECPEEIWTKGLQSHRLQNVLTNQFPANRSLANGPQCCVPGVPAGTGPWQGKWWGEHPGLIPVAGETLTGQLEETK